jgi:hypothetical protein
MWLASNTRWKSTARLAGPHGRSVWSLIEWPIALNSPALLPGVGRDH